MDQDKKNQEDTTTMNDDFPNIEEFSEFEETENLDDFFEDEGQAGADVFDSDALEDADGFESANEGLAHSANASASKSLLKTASSALVIAAVVGGAGFFIYMNEGARGFVSDLTGMQIGSSSFDGMAADDMAASSRLTPRGNDVDVFNNDIPMGDMSVVDSDGDEDFPMPIPVTNAPEIFNTDDASFEELPQPMTNRNANPANLAMNEAPAASNTDFQMPPLDDEMPVNGGIVIANDDLGSFGTFDNVPEMPAPKKVRENPRFQKFDINETKKAPVKEPEPLETVENNEAMGGEVDEFFSSEQALPIGNAPQASNANQKQSPAADTVAEEAAKPKNLPIEERAPLASNTYAEASDDYLDITPAKKPGYSIEVSNVGGGAAAGQYIPQNKPKIAGGATSTSVKAHIVTEANDDPLLVAAERAMKLERYESALRLYETLEIMNPNYVRALKGKADALRALNRLDEAELIYQKVQRLSPHDSEVEDAILGVQATTNPNNALNGLLLKHKQDPINPNIAAQIAISYAKLGDYERSYLFWQKANTLKQNNPVFLYNMAVAADKTMRVTEAIGLYEKALYVDGAYFQGKNLKRGGIYDRLTYLRSLSR